MFKFNKIKILLLVQLISFFFLFGCANLIQDDQESTKPTELQIQQAEELFDDFVASKDIVFIDSEETQFNFVDEKKEKEFEEKLAEIGIKPQISFNEDQSSTDEVTVEVQNLNTQGDISVQAITDDHKQLTLTLDGYLRNNFRKEGVYYYYNIKARTTAINFTPQIIMAKLRFFRGGNEFRETPWFQEVLSQKVVARDDGHNRYKPYDSAKGIHKCQLRTGGDMYKVVTETACY